MSLTRRSNFLPSALRPHRRLVQVLVAAFGSLTTHQVAYSAASLVTGIERFGSANHDHLPLQWALLTPLTVVTAGAFVVRQVRCLGFRSLATTRQLMTLIAGLFVTQETAEVLLAGQSFHSLLSNPALYIGLLSAPLVAWTLTKLLRGVAQIVAWLRKSHSFSTELPRRITKAMRWQSLAGTAMGRPRAPPQLLALRHARPEQPWP